jgi:hypothetical protein
MDSPVVTVAIGVVFLFGTLAVIVAAITEAIGRLLGLRGEYLLRGLRTMLDGGGTFQLTDFGLRGIVRKKKPDEPGQGDQPADREAWVSRLMRHPLVKVTADKERCLTARAIRR